MSTLKSVVRWFAVPLLLVAAAVVNPLTHSAEQGTGTRGAVFSIDMNGHG